MWKDDIHQAIVDAWNDSLGRCCCRLAAPVQRRPSFEVSKSMKSVIAGASGDDSGDGSVDASKFMASVFNSGSSSSRPLSARNRTNFAIPIRMSSEWEEEDSYSEGHPDADPTIIIPEQEATKRRDEMLEKSKAETADDDLDMVEKSQPCQNDAEKLGNCRDCTDDMSQKQKKDPSILKR